MYVLIGCNNKLSSKENKKKLELNKKVFENSTTNKIVSKNKMQHIDLLCIDSIFSYYPISDVTTGKSNKPKLLNNTDFVNKQNFGFYNIIDRKSKLKPPIIAKTIVTYEKEPWRYGDKNQKVVVLIVRDKLFKYNPFSFTIGSNLKQIDSTFQKKTIIEDIYYYKKNDILLALQVKNEIIIKYVIWKNNTSNYDFEKTHAIIKNYLK
jgi:hypothetical protein